MGKVKWENRNRHQITKGQMDYRRKLIEAAIDLSKAVEVIEKKYDLTILDVLNLLNEHSHSFLRAGLEYEEKERWEEEHNVIQKS